MEGKNGRGGKRSWESMEFLKFECCSYASCLIEFESFEARYYPPTPAPVAVVVTSLLFLLLFFVSVFFLVIIATVLT